MTTKQRGLVACVFDGVPQAERAVSDLWQAGFARDRIDMITRSQGVTQATPDFESMKDAAAGATTGAVAGASAGAVAGALATMLIPGIGTVIGGGLLAGFFGGAALGAAGGTFLGPFLALEMNEAEARHYNQALDEGRAVVLVKAFERAAEARAILLRHGGHEYGAPSATPSAV